MAHIPPPPAQVMYNGLVDAGEVFISDGSKCDLGRLQWLFKDSAKVAVQVGSPPLSLTQRSTSHQFSCA